MNSRFTEFNDPRALGAALRNISRLCVTESQLRGIQTPVLTIIGENDHLKPDVDRMKGLIANHRVEVISGANHVQAMLSPRFPELILAFLEEHTQ